MLEELLEVLLIELKEELLVDVLEMSREGRSSPSGLVLVPGEVNETKLGANDRPEILLVDLRQGKYLAYVRRKRATYDAV